MDAMTKKRTTGSETPGDQHTSNRMVRLTISLHDLLKQAARQNQRPMSWELRVALLAHFRAMGLPIPPELEE